MTNEEAIKIINHLPNDKPWEVKALAMAIQALKNHMDYDQGFKDGIKYALERTELE